MLVPHRSKDSRGFGVSCTLHEDEREMICAGSHKSAHMVEHQVHIALHCAHRCVVCVCTKAHAVVHKLFSYSPTSKLAGLFGLVLSLSGLISNVHSKVSFILLNVLLCNPNLHHLFLSFEVLMLSSFRVTPQFLTFFLAVLPIHPPPFLAESLRSSSPASPIRRTLSTVPLRCCLLLLLVCFSADLVLHCFFVGPPLHCSFVLVCHVAVHLLFLVAVPPESGYFLLRRRAIKPQILLAQHASSSTEQRTFS